jgi:2-oxo-3-hexenedioate decarboxylase
VAQANPTGPQADLLARELLDALDGQATLQPLTERIDGFDLEAAYRVVAAVAAERTERGWVRVGRKIGFTNTTVWELFGVDEPMWAPVWDRTVTDAEDGTARLSLDGILQPRIEPEVAFGLRGPVPEGEDPEALLGAVDWIAPAFEVVQSLYPDWRFALPDATAAFGMHAHLVVGPRSPVTDANRGQLAADLATFELTLSDGSGEVERGTGSNVLGSPALALGFLARVVGRQADQPPLAAGEVITTGTVTNAWPVAPGQAWSTDYGTLGLPGLRLTLT